MEIEDEVSSRWAFHGPWGLAVTPRRFATRLGISITKSQ